VNGDRTYPEIAALLDIPRGTLCRKLAAYNKTAKNPIEPRKIVMGNYRQHFFNPAQVEQIKEILAGTASRGKWARKK
jgi:hypothetical protein